MGYPNTRLRRLRSSTFSRALSRETDLSATHLIQPLFVRPGKKVRRPVPSMPGVYQLSVDEAVKEARASHRAGVPAVILFGIPERKDARGQDATAPDGIVPLAVRALKNALPSLGVITDLCLCEYTDHGHCGLLQSNARGETQVDNDSTLEILGEAARVQAAAGADWVAPSGMMDGMVTAIRRALDDSGFSDRAILSYAAKYSSSFYGPFRDAAASRPTQGDRRSHQMDPANRREALREVALDIDEGADVVMVKPALAYLDVIRSVRDRFDVPVAAYNVSGEYAMVKAAAARGWGDEVAMAREILTSIRRAGAQMIVTYHARDMAEVLARS